MQAKSIYIAKLAFIRKGKSLQMHRCLKEAMLLNEKIIIIFK